MPTARTLIITEDGSHSLFHTAFDETYHYTHRAIGEPEHGYINAGLKHYFGLYEKQQALPEKWKLVSSGNRMDGGYGHWKYYANQPWELYDMDNDRSELTDLLGQVFFSTIRSIP